MGCHLWHVEFNKNLFWILNYSKWSGITVTEIHHGSLIYTTQKWVNMDMNIIVFMFYKFGHRSTDEWSSVQRSRIQYSSVQDNILYYTLLLFIVLYYIVLYYCIGLHYTMLYSLCCTELSTRGWNRNYFTIDSFWNRTIIVFIPFHCSDQQNKVLNRF